jgi:hypothetical protein
VTLTPTKSVLSFDTDRIKDYVFATGSLSTIRGASAVLDKLNRVEMPQIISQVATEAKKVFADGGSGMFQLDSSHVDAAIAAVKYLYREKTDTASITGASIEYADEQELKEQLCLLPYRIRNAKEKAPQFMDMVSSSFMKTCESCGISYASKTFTGAEGTEYVCRACYIKKSEDRLQKKQIPRYFSPDFEPDTGRAQPLWQRLSSLLKERKYGGYPEQQYLDRPNDFNELGELSTPSGYTGLIVADGDEMGQTLDQFRSLKEFSDFATIVDQSLYKALSGAVVEYLQPSAGRNVLPFDVLLLAGDDLVMVTRAQSALQVAVQLVEGFSSISEQYGRRLKLSASVVIAHDRFPFQAAHKIAESGLSFAKQKAHELKMQGKEYSTGLINFLVLSNPSSLDFRGIYNTDLKTIAHDGITSNIRTLRPYSPELLHILMETIQELSGVPRTRLHQLAEACYLDRNNSKLNGFTAFSRLQEKDIKKAQVINNLYDNMRKIYGFTDKFAFPWLVDQENNHHSPLVDLLEIFDFVKGGA